MLFKINKRKKYFGILDKKTLEVVKSNFDEKYYLGHNQDVATAEVDAFKHYIESGWKEGRKFIDDSIKEKIIYKFSIPKNIEMTVFTLSRPYLDEIFSKLLKIKVEKYKYQRELFQKEINLKYYQQQLNESIPEDLMSDHYQLIGYENNINPVSYFDRAIYLSNNSDIKSSGVNAFYHFCVKGKKEKRKSFIIDDISSLKEIDSQYVSEFIKSYFDEKYYLQKYKDIKEFDGTAFDHYMIFGWKEARFISANEELCVSYKELKELSDNNVHYSLLRALFDKDMLQLTGMYMELAGRTGTNFDVASIEEQLEYIEEYIDKDFYFVAYPELLEIKLSAAEHYSLFGWKQGKDPSAEFSTQFYLDNNPDVAEAGVNPLFHYVVAGTNERRYGRRPGGAKSDVIYGLDPIEITCSKWMIGEPIELLKYEFVKNIFESISKNIIVSISHDVYHQNVGGIQVCIGIEEAYFNNNNIDYIHLAPYQPLPVLSEVKVTEGDYLFHLSLNGQYVGVVDIDCLNNNFLLIRDKINRATPIIHALHGHSSELLASLFETLDVKNMVVWIHDYFSVCEGYNLLRNTVEYCNAPSKDSKVCQMCLFGANRARHMARIDSLFKAFKLNIISPSAIALDVWEDSVKGRCFINNVDSKEIINHITLKEKEEKENNNDLTRVAFVGYPSFHKGWEDFRELVRNTMKFKNIEYYHIGKNRCLDLPITFVESVVTRDNPALMIESIKEYNIDYVYIPAKWPETFNIVCYEAIAAGARIISHKDVGNVSAFIEGSEHGILFDTVEDVINVIANNKLPKSNVRHYFNVEYSFMTGSSTEVEL